MNNIFISVIISIIGLGYFIYGKRMTDYHFLIGGLLLMIYPYFIQSAILLIIAGLILLAAPFITRRIG